MKSRIAILAAFAGLILAACDSSTNAPTNGTTNPPAATGTVRPGADTAVNVTAGQTLRFQFTPKAGATYTIKTIGNTDIHLELRDSTDKTLATDGASSSINGQIIWISTSTAPIVILVSGETSATYGATILSVTMTNGPDDFEPDNTLHSAQVLKADSSAQKRTITSADVDWIKIPVEAGKTYRVSGIGDYTLYLQPFTADSISLSSYSTSSLSFKAATTGFVYVKAYFYSTSYTGAYTVRAWNDTVGFDKYEPDDTRAQATLITTDSVAQTHYLQAGEDDWFKFDAQLGKSYRITVTSTFTGESYVYPDSTTSTYQISNTSSSFTVKAGKSARMFFDFSGYSSSYSGAYRISVSVDTTGIDKYEPDDTRAQATLITTDSVAQTHYLQASEHDWLKFKADSGKTYKVTVGNFSNGEFFFYRDSTSTSYDSYYYTSGSIKALKTGEIFVDFTGYSSSGSGAYRISVSVDTTGIDKYEPDDTRALATLITTDSVAQSHYLQTGERDWLKFDADSGKIYKITVGNFSNGQFYVYRDSTSASYALSTSSTSGSIKATKTGRIFIDFFGYSTSYSGAYRISVSVDTTGRDKYEPDDLRARANAITTDGLAQSHFIQLADTDWVKFHVDSGSTYLLSTSGTTSTYIHLYPDSTSLSYSTGSTSVGLKAVKSGTYFANVAGYSSTSTGAYSVSVTTSGPDKYEPDDTKATARNIVVDSAAQTHNLVAGEHDWVKFDASTGLTYTILVVNNTNGTWTFDYDLYDSGTSTATLAIGETGSIGITYTPTASGTFYLDIHGLSTGSTGTYTVVVTSK